MTQCQLREFCTDVIHKSHLSKALVTTLRRSLYCLVDGIVLGILLR